MPKERKGDNSFGVASVVLGVVGSVLGVFVFPIVISILGLIFGITQIKKEKNAWAIWGIVLSILGIIISALVIWFVCMPLVKGFLQVMQCQADPTLPGCEAFASALGV